MTIHVLHTPCEMIREEPHGEVRWCFTCRKRVSFVIQTWRPTDPMSYYGPHWSVQCEHGHRDGDLFPGGYREWE